MYEQFLYDCYNLAQVLLWLVSHPLEHVTALFSCDDVCNMFVLRDEVVNLIPNPQCGGLWIVLSLTSTL